MLKNDTLKNGTPRIGLHGSDLPEELYKYKNNVSFKQFLLLLVRNRCDSFIRPD